MKLSKSTVKLAVAAAGVTVAAAGSMATADSAHAFTITSEGADSTSAATATNANNFLPSTPTFTGTLAVGDNVDFIKFTLDKAYKSGGQLLAFATSGLPSAGLKLTLLDAVTNSPIANGTGGSGFFSATGTLNALNSGSYLIRIDRTAGTGSISYSVSANLQPVPEPISMLSGAAAIATAGMMRRKKKLQQQQAEA